METNGCSHLDCFRGFGLDLARDTVDCVSAMFCGDVRLIDCLYNCDGCVSASCNSTVMASARASGVLCGICNFTLEDEEKSRSDDTTTLVLDIQFEEYIVPSKGY